MPVTGMASNPLMIILVVAGAVVVLGGLSAFSKQRKRVE
jgi:LPXTG-motif cell wall-anchored protein